MRTIGVLLLVLLPVISAAQEPRAGSVIRVRPEDNGSYLLTGVVPGSRLLLVTGDGYKGLSLLDYRKGRVRQISTDDGAGYEPVVTHDGRNVIYRSDAFTDHRKFTSMYRHDLETGERVTLLEKERDVAAPAVSGNRVMIRSEAQSHVLEAGQVALKGSGDDIFVVIEEMMPVVYEGNRRKPLMPNGEGFYIWASLSPDRSKIVYNYQGGNTFICDTDGRVLHDAGRINAPKWLSDNIIIGMDDKDDGYRITSSELVWFSLPEGKRGTLTGTATRSEMFPFPFRGGRKIAFCTDNGEIYVMKIRIR